MLKLVYGQEVIRYKMQYLHSIAYLLYYQVISNCIVAFIAYHHCCHFLMQILFHFLSIFIFCFSYIQLCTYGFERTINL
jgi:hypothetical protein